MTDQTCSYTDYGTAVITRYGVTVSATHAQLYAWAHRDGAWPCSTLEDLDEIRAHFDANGLVDLIQSPAETDENNVTYPEIMGDELSAWSSDVLRAAKLTTDHPAYYVTVGQFEDAR